MRKPAVYLNFTGLLLAGILISTAGLAADGCAVPAQEWDDAAAAQRQVEDAGDTLSPELRQQLAAEWATIKALYDDIANETAPICKERRDFNEKDAQLAARQDDLTARVNAHNADPNRTDEAAAALNAEQAALNQELADLNQWAADLNQRIAQINQNNLAHYTAFTEKVRAALAAGFTGTKTVRLSAKSWINGAALPLLTSIKGIMLRMDPNTAPSGPGLSDADDFKLYQTFTAQAEFVNGKVVGARFVEDALDVRSGTTLGVDGLIYVKESNISAWHGKDSVTFTRTVAGRPALLFADPIEWTMDEPFQDIWNTVAVDINGDNIKAHGYGSDFPSHTFWVDDDLLYEKSQVAPAEYFK